MDKIVLAGGIVAIVLSRAVSPEKVIEYARQQNAIIKRRGSDYFMIQLSQNHEPELWGVDTFKSTWRQALLDAP